MIPVISRILARYASGALVAYGLMAMPDAAAIEPDLALLAGAVLGAIAEAAYALARRYGWAK